MSDHGGQFDVSIDLRPHQLDEGPVVVTVDDVRPGDAYPFETPIRGIELLDEDDTPTCEIDEVTGPLPFGLNVETD